MWKIVTPFLKILNVRAQLQKRNSSISPISTRKLATLGKCTSYLKILERLLNVPSRPVISNCGTPTEKVSEFLEFHLKPVMQNCKSNIKDSNDFVNKIKSIHSLPKNAILGTANLVGLNPSIFHGLKAPIETLEKRDLQKISTNDLVKMAEFVLKSNFFEFRQQISGITMGTEFAPA